MIVASGFTARIDAIRDLSGVGHTPVPTEPAAKTA